MEILFAARRSNCKHYCNNLSTREGLECNATRSDATKCPYSFKPFLEVVEGVVHGFAGDELCFALLTPLRQRRVEDNNYL